MLKLRNELVILFRYLLEMLEIFQNTVLLYFYLIKIIHAHQLKNLKDRKAYNEKQKSPSAVPLPEGDSFNVFSVGMGNIFLQVTSMCLN